MLTFPLDQSYEDDKRDHAQELREKHADSVRDAQRDRDLFPEFYAHDSDNSTTHEG